MIGSFVLVEMEFVFLGMHYNDITIEGETLISPT
jgi:hypothetical protein